MRERSGEDAFAADDDASRERALDIGRSFLVQAPAGSGKTGLLIQRYLALLAHVERPEQIVAMTFTRKAAGEMRERIVAALRDPDAGTPAASTHVMRTRALAKAALAQDSRQGWGLADHPSRLSVFTIDALSATLVRQAPLATGMGAAPHIEERAAPLYSEAARTALAAAHADDPAWRRLLWHLDNDADLTVALVAGMLAKRDQWMSIVMTADRSGFRASLEAALATEITGEIAEAAKLFPATLAGALTDFERYAAVNLTNSTESADLAGHLAACAAQGGAPPPMASAQPSWQALVDWLLVSGKAQFRVAVDKRRGFPAVGKDKDSPARQLRNVAMRSLLADLAAVAGLADALHAVRCLPPPRYTDQAWAIVEALLDVLPRAADELLRTFSAAGAIDFMQGTIAALDALGDEEAPSDLLLRIDYQLQHLLIDEFQDTSFTQIELIRRLTAGWQVDDGRTLFAVGDPMQSIYRFRAAEVRLFVEAQQDRRVAALPVENLVLRRNFRSQARLVDWCNGVFSNVLGSRSDPWRGTVGFAAALAANAATPGPAATLDIAIDEQDESRAIVRHVRAALDAGANEVAILVRARSHLDHVLPALRAAGIAFAAVELDALAERQAITDLVSLTHALVQPADRLAWLATLRAPWCGMTLADLLAVVKDADRRCSGSIAGLIDDADPVAGLSEDGRLRFERLAKALVPVLGARGRAGIAARMNGAWLALGGPATLIEPIDLDAAERYFALLAEHDAAGDVADWPAFVDSMRKLYADPEAAETASVQVMTLHRAKGLEFDTVILPGLARRPKRSDDEILRWRRRPQGLLLAPMKGKGGADDPVHAYLGRLASAEAGAELGRLLYVGCTRARRRLHLTAVLESETTDAGTLEWKSPLDGSALAKFWDCPGIAIPAPTSGHSLVPLPPPPRLLARTPVDWTVRRPEPGVPVIAVVTQAAEPIPFDWARETARHAGSVTHRILAQIGSEGPGAWDAARVKASDPRVRAELTGEGVDDADLDRAAAGVLATVDRMLTDPRGRWLLDTVHEDARSEWGLAGVDGDAIVHVVLDRTFVAEGVRWIVDFKTGAHEGGDLEAFLDREVARYRAQLERYARLVRALDSRPIRLGLYFPAHGGWRDWSYDS
ncbi:MAG: UvrD-helicase domain-containing protein [Betaproteobacteria bacterium]